MHTTQRNSTMKSRCTVRNNQYEQETVDKRKQEMLMIGYCDGEDKGGTSAGPYDDDGEEE